MGLLALLIPLFVRRIPYVNFFGDESYWIASSYFMESFISGDFSAEAWPENKWTVDQTPLARYVIGLGRWLGGYGVSELPQGYNFELSLTENIAEGRVPSEGLLWWSRLPMALLMALIAAAWFGWVRRVFDRLTACCFMAFYVFNNYLTGVTVRATPEALLLGSIVFTAIAGWWAVQAWRAALAHNAVPARAVAPVLSAFALVGIGSGLAGAAKLNGLAAGAAGLVLCGLLVVPQSHIAAHKRWLLAACAGGIVIVFTIAVFVATNPYLFADTGSRLARLVSVRFSYMETDRLVEVFPDSVMPTVAERLSRLPQALFHAFAPLRLGDAGVVYGTLVLAGLAAAILPARRLLTGELQPFLNTYLLVFAAVVSLPALLTPLYWDRYYLLPAFFCLTFAALGLAPILRWGYRGLRHVQALVRIVQ